MGPSENAQHAIRRSTRLPLEVPVQVTSLSPHFSFSERCNTTLVNAHGCGLISPRALEMNLPVRLEIISAKRHTTAQVSEVVPLGGEPETWLIGLELNSPGNFWGIEYAPSDWAVEEIIGEASRPASLPIQDSGKSAKPPRRWRLTDVSAGACYLESTSPFPVDTPVLLSVRTEDKEYVLDGVVRISHPENGMGIEFAPAQSQQVENLIAHLAGTREAPRVFVGRKEREQAAPSEPAPARERGAPDLLLDLVLSGPALTQEQFFSDLRAQRLGKRRDPRIDVALPVLLTGVDVSGRPLSQRVMTVNISRRGALLEGIHGELKFGDKISLTRSGKKEEFRVAWVRDADTPEGACIGVAAVDQNTTFWDKILDDLSAKQNAGAI